MNECRQVSVGLEREGGAQVYNQLSEQGEDYAQGSRYYNPQLFLETTPSEEKRLNKNDWQDAKV